MRSLVLALLGFFLATAAGAEPPIAFVAVNVLPMDGERILANQIVLVRDRKIEAIGPNLAIPQGALVIDGHGTAYLSPGLADMHVHAETPSDFAVYLANGVTSVLNMGGASARLVDVVAPRANKGEIPAPHVYVSFMVDGSPRYSNFVVKNAAEARALVRLAKSNGYDFIKVYNDLSAECFLALVDEGRKRGIAVIGHGVTAVGLEKQLDAGQIMVAHTEEFLYSTFGYPDRGQPTEAQIPAAIAFLKRDHAFVTADLITYATIARQWGKPEIVKQFLDRPELRYISPDRRLGWIRSDYAARTTDISGNVALLRTLTKAMSDAGVPLITGTDSPSIAGLLPGYSLHDDLDILEAAGLSRFQVLSAATRTPGEFIKKAIKGAEPFGTVAPGNRADLILTAGNPLDGLATLRQPLGVMGNGHWYARADLDALLAKVADSYDQASAHH